MVRERSSFVSEIAPGSFVTRIVERFYGAPNWIVVEEFDVTRDVQVLINARMPKDVAQPEPEPSAEDEAKPQIDQPHEGEVVTE